MCKGEGSCKRNSPTPDEKLLLARVKAQLQAGHSRSELERLVQQRTKDLTESEQRYRTLVQMSPVGIVQIQVTDAVVRWQRMRGRRD